MPIRRLAVKNFKSFKDVEVELGDFNVLIGANAGGKTNFVELFRFIRDIQSRGLEDAIMRQGGVEYLTNRRLGWREGFYLEIVRSLEEEIERGGERRQERMRIRELVYHFALNFSEEGEARVSEECLSYPCKFFREREDGEREEIGEGEIKFFRQGENWEMEPSLPSSIKQEDVEAFFLFDVLQNLTQRKAPPGRLLIEPEFFRFVTPNPLLMFWPFGEIRTFYFDPRESKIARSPLGRGLGEHGENLPLALREVLKSGEKDKFLSLLHYLLSFVEDADVERFTDGSFAFKLKERHLDGFLPSPYVSDGTVQILCLLLALYFSQGTTVIIEEPERNIHASLLSRVVEMMKEVGEERQVIVTTHNPEFVKYAGLESLLLIHRDVQGFSQITRPSEREKVKRFLREEIGLDELFVRNLLNI